MERPYCDTLLVQSQIWEWDFRQLVRGVWNNVWVVCNCLRAAKRGPMAPFAVSTTSLPLGVWVIACRPENDEAFLQHNFRVHMHNQA